MYQLKGEVKSAGSAGDSRDWDQMKGMLMSDPQASKPGGWMVKQILISKQVKNKNKSNCCGGGN